LLRNALPSSGSHASLRASAECAADDSQRVAVQTTVLSADPADQYPLVAWMSGDNHADLLFQYPDYLFSAETASLHRLSPSWRTG